MLSFCPTLMFEPKKVFYHSIVLKLSVHFSSHLVADIKRSLGAYSQKRKTIECIGK